jgi:hypothetical protein
MIWILLTLQVLIGALWRAVLDGWRVWALWMLKYKLIRWAWKEEDGLWKLRRPVIVCSGVLLTWPLWLWLPWWWALVGSVAAMLYYVMGHHVDSWRVWVRYLGVGAIGYWAAHRWWPNSWRWGDFIDGWMRIGAMWAGAVGWGAVFLIGWCLGAPE